MRKRIRGSTPIIEHLAVDHRKQPTAQEAILWQALRSGKLHGLKFRRQYAVGRFILDFCCAEIKLALELDGSIHEQQKERDEERDSILKAYGYTVLRISNDEMDRSLSEVLQRIREVARKHQIQE